jgi:hypothetical protein
MPKRGSDDDEQDLINAEFDSLVAGLNLDQSSPTTYLDELDGIEKSEAFKAPHIPAKKVGRKSFLESLQSARMSFEKWKRNRGDHDGDGAVL